MRNKRLYMALKIVLALVVIIDTTTILMISVHSEQQKQARFRTTEVRQAKAEWSGPFLGRITADNGVVIIGYDDVYHQVDVEYSGQTVRNLLVPASDMGAKNNPADIWLCQSWGTDSCSAGTMRAIAPGSSERPWDARAHDIRRTTTDYGFSMFVAAIAAAVMTLVAWGTLSFIRGIDNRRRGKKLVQETEHKLRQESPVG